MNVTDRSRIESANRCLRSRYWGYEYRGRGVQRLTANVPLSTGSAVHAGLEMLLKETTVGIAVSQALDTYLADVAAGIGLQSTDSTAQDDVIKEQRALLEALIRGYAAIRLPLLLAEYEVVAVEQEYTSPLTPELSLMVRADALLRRRSDGLLFIMDFKTVSEAGMWWRNGFRYDTLTMSQVLPIEAAVGERLGGVIIEGLCKGRRSEYPKGSGKWQQGSPLIYAWRKADGEEWCPRYEWSCVEPHWTNGKKPVMCAGGKTHKLSGFYKARVWEEYPGRVAAWMEWLLANDRALVEEQFVQLPPILRSEWEVEEWRTSAIAQETRIAKDAQWINAVMAAGGDIANDMRTMFPKNTVNGNCLSCQFNEICWGNASPDDPTMYKVREYNHPVEGVDTEAGVAL